MSLRHIPALLLALIVIGGCHAKGIHEVMSDYHYTELTPPTVWELGSVVEIDPRIPDAPDLRSTPAMAGATIATVDSPAPDVSQSGDDKLDLSLGMSLPHDIKANAAAKGARQYSVVTGGNLIRRAPLDPYAIDTFPVMAQKYGSNWKQAIEQGRLFYIYEIWTATKMDYRFFDERGISLKLDVPIDVGSAEVAAGWSARSDGTVTYSGPALAIGYKYRPVLTGPEPGAGPTPKAIQLTAQRKLADNNPKDR